jgi:hypothetical protein
MATRPALLYYCAMSLALAEVLLKQSGESRLEKLRERHNGHGLVMSLTGSLRVTDTLRSAASSLVAKQQVWASPDIPDTFDSVAEDIGGVQWNAGDTRRSSSVRR